MQFKCGIWPHLSHHMLFPLVKVSLAKCMRLFTFRNSGEQYGRMLQTSLIRLCILAIWIQTRGFHFALS